MLCQKGSKSSTQETKLIITIPEFHPVSVYRCMWVQLQRVDRLLFDDLILWLLVSFIRKLEIKHM